MKLVSVETPEKSVCKMTFSATAEELEAASNAVYERTRATYTIKGFQKGEKGHLFKIIHRQPAPPIEGHSPFIGQIMSESLYLCPQIQQFVPIPALDLLR